MKHTTRFAATLAPVLFAVVALLLPAVAYGQNTDSKAPFTVHEWGTFTSVAGEDGSPVDWNALGCRNDLPQFVSDYGFRFKWKLQGTVRMETPVLYFYSPRELDAQVKVGFPQGLITEWFPKAQIIAYQKSKTDGALRVASPDNPLDETLRGAQGTIEWKNIKVQPGATPGFPMEESSSRYYAARATDSTPLSVDGQHEKFLFYRGVGRFPVPLTARVSSDGKITIQSLSGSVPTVMLFENRQGHIGYRVLGSIDKSRTFDMPALDGSLAQLRTDLESTLVAQGLYAKEAQAMVETWQDSWFEEGSRLIYIVPRAAVDSILPLQVTPAPDVTARVFVGRIELFTPATMRSVETSISAGDWKAVNRYDRFLVPLLDQIYPHNPGKVALVEQSYQKATTHDGSGCTTGAH